MDIDWLEEARIYMHLASYLLRPTRPVTCEMSVSGQGQTRPDKVETTATQNIIEVIYMECFGLANIFLLYQFFDVLQRF